MVGVADALDDSGRVAGGFGAATGCPEALDLHPAAVSITATAASTTRRRGVTRPR